MNVLFEIYFGATRKINDAVRCVGRPILTLRPLAKNFERIIRYLHLRIKNNTDISSIIPIQSSEVITIKKILLYERVLYVRVYLKPVCKIPNRRFYRIN